MLDAIAEKHEVTLIDVARKQEYDLRGFDTFGPFKLVGGIKKGRSTSGGHPLSADRNGV